MVCFFHLRRSRCSDCDRAAYCAQAVVHLCDGFRRDIDRDGAVRRQLGSVPGVFWSGFDSLGTGDHFRGMSRNVGCGRRADPADSSAFRSNHDASRRPDFSGGADDHSGRSPVRTGGKTQRSRLATGERQHTTGFLVGIFTGFCFGHPWLDAESGARLRGKHSACRAATWRESCHDVERCLVALPLRRVPSGCNLLLHPDAQER